MSKAGVGAALQAAGQGLMQYTQYNIEEMRQKNLDAIRQRERGEDQAIHTKERGEDVTYRNETAAAEQKRHEATLQHQRDEATFGALDAGYEKIPAQFAGLRNKIQEQKETLLRDFNERDDAGNRKMSEADYKVMLDALNADDARVSQQIESKQEFYIKEHPEYAERLRIKAKNASPIMEPPPAEDAASPVKEKTAVVPASAGKLGDPIASATRVASDYNGYMKRNPKATTADVDAYMGKIWDSNWKDAVLKKGTKEKLSAPPPGDKAVRGEFEKRAGGTEGAPAFKRPVAQPATAAPAGSGTRQGRSATSGAPPGPNGMTVQGAIAADMNVMELAKAGASPDFVRAVLGEMKRRQEASEASPSVPRADAAHPAVVPEKTKGKGESNMTPAGQLSPKEVRAMIKPEAEKAGVPSTLLERMVAAESSGDPGATSDKGAAGLAQFTKSGGIAQLKKMGHIDDSFDPYDPAQATRAMALYMKYLLGQFGGDERKAVAAYNWGETKLRSAGPAWESKAPKETKDYLRKVLG